MPLLTLPAAQAAEACPTPNAGLATAKATTTPLKVSLNGLPLDLGGVSLAPAGVKSDQTGPGTTSDSGVHLSIPGDGGPSIVKADILKSETSAAVTTGPIKAVARGMTEVAHLDVASGMIVADIVRADSKATATTSGAHTDSLPSTIEGLRVNNEWYSYVEPGKNIPLPTEVFGAGSYVKIHDRVDRSKLPTTTNPFYKAEVELSMIKVHLTDASPLPGLQTLDVLVANSWAQARASATCEPLQQSVKGAAYTARLWPEGWDGTFYTFGNQKIGPTGGTAGQALVDQDFSMGDQTFTVESLKTTVTGVIKPGESSIVRSTSEVTDICLDFNGIECFVTAGVMRTEANAVANPWAAYEWGSTVFVDLVINGIDVCKELGIDNPQPGDGEVTCSPPPNHRMDNLVPGFHITLNEQWGDPAQAGYIGLTVRALRIETGDGYEIPGNVLVARSYAAAEYKAGA